LIRNFPVIIVLRNVSALVEPLSSNFGVPTALAFLQQFKVGLLRIVSERPNLHEEKNSTRFSAAIYGAATFNSASSKLQKPYAALCIHKHYEAAVEEVRNVEKKTRKRSRRLHRTLSHVVADRTFFWFRGRTPSTLGLSGETPPNLPQANRRFNYVAQLVKRY
jgi:hypothetical protein